MVILWKGANVRRPILRTTLGARFHQPQHLPYPHPPAPGTPLYSLANPPHKSRFGPSIQPPLPDSSSPTSPHPDLASPPMKMGGIRLEHSQSQPPSASASAHERDDGRENTSPAPATPGGWEFWLAVGKGEAFVGDRDIVYPEPANFDTIKTPTKRLWRRWWGWDYAQDVEAPTCAVSEINVVGSREFWEETFACHTHGISACESGTTCGACTSEGGTGSERGASPVPDSEIQRASPQPCGPYQIFRPTLPHSS